MDDRLRIHWNAKAQVEKPGKIDAVGHSAAPTYGGRWQVIRIPGEGELIPAIIYTVRENRTEAYKPIGMWLVEFMQKWDSANRHFLETMRKEWQEHDEVIENRLKISDDAGAKDFLENQWDKFGGEKHFIGRGF